CAGDVAGSGLDFW
nr:immunoglobulin heavy chain junction region [Macaca mulatta]MOX94962.1 immunoglobulin heavy chain junction region [Macaca mulatta]